MNSAVQGDGDTTVADFVGEYTQTDDGRYVFVRPFTLAVRAMHVGRYGRDEARVVDVEHDPGAGGGDRAGRRVHEPEGDDGGHEDDRDEPEQAAEGVEEHGSPCAAMGTGPQPRPDVPRVIVPAGRPLGSTGSGRRGDSVRPGRRDR